MEATGVIATGESAAGLAYIRARRGLSPRQTLFIVAVCVLAFATPIGTWFAGWWQPAVVTVEAAAVGFIVGMLIVRWLKAVTTRKALAARGQSYHLPLTLRLTDEELVYDLADVMLTARWTCVTDLYQTRKYWVFLFQTSAMVLPRRFFATPETEKAFIAEALSKMSDAARVRSPHATQFIAASRSDPT